MQAIIRCGNGEFYCSPLFGFYFNRNSGSNPFDAYVVCFNKRRDRLVKQLLYDPNKKPYLNLMVLITDNDKTDWTTNDSGYEGVDFLPLNTVSEIINKDIIPEEIVNKCKQLDLHEDFSDFKPVKTKHDIEKLMLITGNFHDAIISTLVRQPDNSLYVLFDGVWGCTVELVFSDDVAYNTDNNSLEFQGPYWFEAFAAVKDEYIYFADVDMENHELSDDDCWFRAKSMKYRIIPE